MTMRRGVAAIPHALNERDMTAPRGAQRRHSNRWTPNGLTKVDSATARAHGLPNAAAMATTLNIETARPSIDLVHAEPRRPRGRERRLRRLPEQHGAATPADRRADPADVARPRAVPAD